MYCRCHCEFKRLDLGLLLSVPSIAFVDCKVNKKIISHIVAKGLPKGMKRSCLFSCNTVLLLRDVKLQVRILLMYIYFTHQTFFTN